MKSSDIPNLPPMIPATPPKLPPRKLENTEPEINEETVLPFILKVFNCRIQELANLDDSEKEKMLESIQSLNESFLKDQKNPELIKKLFSLANILDKDSRDPEMIVLYQSLAIQYPKENFVKTLKALVFNAAKRDTS